MHAGGESVLAITELESEGHVLKVSIPERVQAILHSSTVCHLSVCKHVECGDIIAGYSQIIKQTFAVQGTHNFSKSWPSLCIGEMISI